MNVSSRKLRGRRGERGFIVLYVALATGVIIALAGISSYVVNNLSVARNRQGMIAAFHYADGGVAIGAYEAQSAYLASDGTTSNFVAQLAAASPAWTNNASLTTTNQYVYQRTVSTPFNNQTVSVQMLITNTGYVSSFSVVSSATVDSHTQTVQLDLQVQFRYKGVVLSDNQGDSGTDISKSNAQDGNICVDGNSGGKTVLDGDLISNGGSNVDGTTVSTNNSRVSEYLYGTTNAIPDYTTIGSANQLFDFNRFIAVADVNGTHYTTLTNFIAHAKSTTLEGVIVVDIIPGYKGSLDDTTLPNGINIRGTLIFNFSGGWKVDDKIINTADMYINAANLTGLNATDRTTYTTGYPPSYSNPSLHPTNVNITAYGYYNFRADEDLPAMMYNTGILDMHGNVDICGVVYSPSFMEIENKQDNQKQYFRGMLIVGGGAYIDNDHKSTTVVSYDENSADLLASSGTKGKVCARVFWTQR